MTSRLALGITILMIAMPSIAGPSAAHQDSKAERSAPGNRSASAKEAVDRLREVNSTAEERAQRLFTGPALSSAEQEVLAFGSPAIQPLLELLTEMLEQWKRDREENGLGHHVDNVERALMTIEDCCELLGHLKAVDAVPLILNVMERKVYLSMVPKRDTEVLALTRIGKAGIPAIVAELGRAFDKISAENDTDLRTSPRKDLVKRGIEMQTASAQLQMSAALDDIGDESTAELLEQLLKSDRYMGESATEIIQERITAIRTKSTRRLSW